MNVEGSPSDPLPEGAPLPEPLPETGMALGAADPQAGRMPDELLDRRVHEIVERMKVMTLGRALERYRQKIADYEAMTMPTEGSGAAPPAPDRVAEAGPADGESDEEEEEIPDDDDFDPVAEDQARLAFLESARLGEIGARVERERREGKDGLALGAGVLDIVYTLAELREIGLDLDELRRRPDSDESRLPQSAADADPHLAQRLVASRTAFRALASRNPELSAMSRSLRLREWIEQRESDRRRQWGIMSKLYGAPKQSWALEITTEMKVYDRFLSGATRPGDGSLLQRIVEKEIFDDFEFDEAAFIDALRGAEGTYGLDRQVHKFAELDRIHELAGAFDRTPGTDRAAD